MKKYSVQTYPSAEQDLVEIRDYFGSVLKPSATPLFEKFLHHLEILETDPLIYAQVKEQTLREKGYRTVVVDNFLMFYGARDYTNLL